MEPLRVLLVEDSPSDAKLVVHALRRTGRIVEVERVETESALREALGRGTWDVVVSDWSMPKFSAPAALAIVRELAFDLPFIIVSGTIGEEHAVSAMRTGANDYVLKGNLGRLPIAVERELQGQDTRRARRSAEIAQREAEERKSAVIDTALDGVIVMDHAGIVLEFNPAAERTFGYKRAEAMGATLASLIIPERFRESHRLGLARYVATNESSMIGKRIELSAVRKDGTEVPVELSVLRYGPDKAPKFVGFIRDISEQKRVEQANVSLEEQLRQSQKMEAIGRLAGGIAHDFNNLLSVVLGYSGMLLADLKHGDPIRDDLEEIRRAGVRAAELTGQLLTFSRQQPIEPRALDLNQVLSSMERMLRRLVGEDVELTAVPGAGIGAVYLDPGSLEQVIMNLAVNARDAMPTGGKLTMETANVEVDNEYVRSHLGAKPGSYVMLSVTDSGVGMDRATMDRIFEPFFTTKEQGKGTGLGLSTVFGIVQQSAGNIWVYSELGVGTTFKIYFPRVDAVTASVHAQPLPKTLRGSETILLVEDEEQVRDVARGILKRHGYEILEARNAGEAILLCERHPKVIHLLLTDVVMPQMSGPELAKRLVELRPDMKVICMSGYTDDAAVRHGMIDAVFAYLQKPITVESLTRKVREVIDAKPTSE